MKQFRLPFQDSRIRTKLLLGFGAIALLTILVSTIATLAAMRYRQAAAGKEHAEVLQHLLHQEEIATWQFLSGDERGAEAYYQAHAAIEEQGKALEEPALRSVIEREQGVYNRAFSRPGGLFEELGEAQEGLIEKNNKHVARLLGYKEAWVTQGSAEDRHVLLILDDIRRERILVDDFDARSTGADSTIQEFRDTNDAAVASLVALWQQQLDHAIAVATSPQLRSELQALGRIAGQITATSFPPVSPEDAALLGIEPNAEILLGVDADEATKALVKSCAEKISGYEESGGAPLWPRADVAEVGENVTPHETLGSIVSCQQGLRVNAESIFRLETAYVNDIEPAFAAVHEELHAYLSDVSNSVTEITEQLERFAPIASAVAIGVTVLLVLLGTATIVKPVLKLRDAALRFAQGDLDARAPVTSQDEIGQLANAFNHMARTRKQAEDELRFLQTLALAISEAEDLDSALSAALQKVGEVTAWAYGDAWTPNAEGTLLLWRAGWHSGAQDPAEFERASRAFTFAPGTGLPGRVWTSKQPAWVREVTDDRDFPRATLAREAGLRTAVAVPVLAGDQVVAVIAFYMSEARDEDEWLVKLVSSAAAQLGTLVRRKQAEEALRQSEERARSIVKTAYDAFISIDARGVITDWNPQAETIFGWSREEVIGRNLDDTIIPPQHREAHLKGLQRFLATGGPVLNQRIESTALHRDGHEFPVELAIWAVNSGDSYTFNAFVHDITGRKRAEEELRRLNEELAREQHEIDELNRSLEAKVKERTRDLRERNRQLVDARAQAATDSLTGLPNHRTFHQRIREYVQQARRTGSPVSLIMLDIDGFKRINDSQGHLAGDDILRQFAFTVADVTTRGDAYRYGGDEFAVLLPAVDGRKATRMAERLRRAVERGVDGNAEKVTVSLGVASFPDTAASAEELIYGADAAMYWAKSAGKNRVGDWGELVNHMRGETLPWYTAAAGVKAPDVVTALTAALAAKDPMTSAHTERCSWYAARLAEELGLSDEETSVARLASLLHDIGKLAVHDDVLFKPGPLNEDEWAEMKKHPTTALHVLGHIRSMSDAAPAILHHHEHFDGSGYPDGLAGDRIPIASRILLVTDAFDAMTTDRPYRKAMSVEAAIEELKRNSGSQFDPAVVDAFLRILSREGAEPCAGTRQPARNRR